MFANIDGMLTLTPPSTVWYSASHTWVLALSALLVGGCGQCDVDIVHSDRAGHSEETVAQLAITGMMCEIACVSKVRKELYNAQGVAHADIHFDKDLTVDTAFVTYDPALIQPEDLIATVQEIGDGLYAVKSAEVIHYAPESHH